MKVWLSRLGIQYKLFMILGLGFVGFLLYFAVDFSITQKNQQVMTALIDEHLPTLEAVESLAQTLTLMKNVIVKSSFSGNMEDLSELAAANKKTVESFSILKNQGHVDPEDLDKSELTYLNAYKNTNDYLQNVVAGLDSLSDVQTGINSQAQTLRELEQWALTLKENKTNEIRALVDYANAGSRRMVTAGFILLLGGIPFAIFFFMMTKNMSERLKEVSSRLMDVSQVMLEISTDASSSSNKLASASSEQASSVMESVSSMDQMQAKLSETVKHSADALRFSETSFREASDGKEAIDSLRSSMTDIQNSNEQLEEVNDIVLMIREKTNIINDIVFKTQLLSFNASIEAARAGQHGRGFSVVAAEVGKLAETSGGAAQEIGKLLDHSTKKVAEIINGTKEKVGSANKMSQHCAGVFEGITQRTGEVTTMVSSISDAAADQETGIKQVGGAMTQMRQSAEETDQMAHSISKLSEVLKQHSMFLAEAVKNLDILVHGEANEAKPIEKANSGRKPPKSDGGRTSKLRSA